jgi:hypothetical protein
MTIEKTHYKRQLLAEINGSFVFAKSEKLRHETALKSKQYQKIHIIKQLKKL